MSDRSKNKQSKPSFRQLAVALRYNKDLDAAPRVVAKGRGLIAKKILELAEEQNIPVRSDPDLTHLLAQLELDQVIPPELYPAVAEILAYIYRMNEAKAAQKRQSMLL